MDNNKNSIQERIDSLLQETREQEIIIDNLKAEVRKMIYDSRINDECYHVSDKDEYFVIINDLLNKIQDDNLRQELMNAITNYTETNKTIAFNCGLDFATEYTKLAEMIY